MQSRRDCVEALRLAAAPSPPPLPPSRPQAALGGCGHCRLHGVRGLSASEQQLLCELQCALDNLLTTTGRRPSPPLAPAALVINLIDAAYASSLSRWHAMVRAAPTQLSLHPFVVALIPRRRTQRRVPAPPTSTQPRVGACTALTQPPLRLVDTLRPRAAPAATRLASARECAERPMRRLAAGGGQRSRRAMDAECAAWRAAQQPRRRLCRHVVVSGFSVVYRPICGERRAGSRLF